MNILAIDTASSTGAVAVMKNNSIVGSIQLNTGLTHSERLLPAIDSILQLIKMDMKEFDGIAITQGPGSFTGLRIGFSTAKGMALGLKIPLIPIPTLDVLAQNGMGTQGLIVPIMNARRSQVYTAVYRCEGNTMTRQSDYQAIAIEQLLDSIQANASGMPVYFTGDGVDVFDKVIIERLGSMAIFAIGCRKYVCGDALAMCAVDALDAWSNTDWMRAEPIYLRESEAVIQWLNAHPGESLES